MTLSIKPWGEVFVNGKRRGVAPPLAELSLAPGKYVVEIRNDRFETHRETIYVRAGSNAKVSHRFNDAPKEPAKERATTPAPRAQPVTPLLSDEWPR